MVLDLAEMDFNLKVKWWVRPRQLDGSTVEDYYTQFCNWRDEMVRLSIPAEEEDYVEQFILNLRWEIRYRLYRYESWSRLIDVFRAAKFEESMMIIEENLRQIKAHMVFDEMSHPENGKNDEIQGAEVVGDENGDEILVQIEEDSENDVSPNAEDNKSTGLEFLVRNPIPDDDNMEQIKANSVFDVMPSQTSVSLGSDSDDDNADNSKVDMESNEQLGIAEVTMQLAVDSHNFVLTNGVECKMFKYFTKKSTEANFADAVYQVFDKMTNPGYTFLHSVSLVPLFGNEEKDDLSSTKVDNQVVDYKLDDNIWLYESLMLIFDPGGCFRPHRVCGSSFNCRNEQEDFCWTTIVDESLIDDFSMVKCQEDDILQSIISITEADPNIEPHANKDPLSSTIFVLFSLDSVNCLRCAPLSMNNLVPPSPNSVTMVCCCTILAINSHLFDLGGGCLPLTASYYTLSDKYAQHDEISMPNNKCVCVVEWSSVKACKPQKEMLADYICWTQGALNRDDVELVQMAFFIVPTMIQVSTIFQVSSDNGSKAGVVSLLVLKGVRRFRHFSVVTDKIKLLYKDELVTEMVMINGVEWNLQTEQGCGVWKEAISLDISIIHCLAETFFRLMVLKSIPKLLMNIKEERNLLLVLNEDFLGQLQLPFHCHSISLFAFQNLSCLIGCFIPCGPKYIQQYMSSNGYDGVTVTMLQNYVWDPGQNVIFLYILEDKDVVERVGKDIVLMDTTLVIRRYDHEVQMRCFYMIDIVSCCYLQECAVTDANCKHVMLQVEQFAQGLDILPLLNEKDRDMGLIYNMQRASTLLHTLTLSCKLGGSALIIHRGVVMINPSFIVVVENFVWDPGLILVYFRISTLRTRWLLRGRICHELTFYYKFYMYFRIMYLAGMTSLR